ncbi:hypothetical protein PRIEUP_LOCUS5713 [Pristimantis euphronides]
MASACCLPASERLLGAPGFPWLVSVEDSSRSHLAAGAIISDFWIVTSPSSLKLRNDLSIVVGITGLDTVLPHDRAVYAIHKVIVHEEFDEILHTNDIMLLMTGHKIKFSSTVQLIWFPSWDPDNAALSNCTVSGWTGPHNAGHQGSTSWCSLSVKNMNQCPLQKTLSTACYIHHGHGDPGCVGIGGSPVSCQMKGMEKWLLAGVLPGSGMRPYLPVLYTRTSFYYEWISSRTREAGRLFTPTVTMIIVHPQSATIEKEQQLQGEKNEGLFYDYYNADNILNTGGHSSSPEVLLIVFVIFFAN